MSDKLTINGLQEGISVIEHNNENIKPSFSSDILYNESEPINFETSAFNNNTSSIYELQGDITITSKK